MSRLNLLVRGLAPAAAAVCAVGMMSTAAWANQPGPPHPPPPHPIGHPAPPRPIAHPAPPPPSVHAPDCTRTHGRVAPDPHNPRSHLCLGGQFNGRPIS